MQLLVLLLYLNLLEKAFGIQYNDTLIENTHLQDTGERSCKGPGSDPYRNFVFNGRCNCKRNVRGQFCSECKPNSFSMSANRQHGCLRCFCSGVASKCQASNWFVTRLFLSFTNDSQGVQLVYKNLSSVNLPVQVDSINEGIFVDGLPDETADTYYWKLPQVFLGDRLTSYGGFMNFTINYEVHPTEPKERKWLKDPLAVITGNGLTIYYRFRKRNRRTASHFLPIVEQGWFKVLDRPPSAMALMMRKKFGPQNTLRKRAKRRRRSKRREVMKVLSDVEYILVKANYRNNARKVSLLQISMSHAVPSTMSHAGATRSEDATQIGYATKRDYATDKADNGYFVAESVEKCDCPEGFSGLSCQYCSSGYTRHTLSLRKKRFQNGCYPCQCNGNSNECHQENGTCMNCQHNTTGDHCQISLLQCDERGTFKQSAEPTVPARCICKARVQGEICDSCRPGYFNLNKEDEKGCKKCWCNGVTFKCTSSKLKRFQIIIQPPAYINMGFYDGIKKHLWAQKVKRGRARFDFRQYEHFYDFHWSLPKKFTGNILKSYGGNLNFSLYNEGSCDRNIPDHPFVELESFDGEVVIWKFNPRTIVNAWVSFSVKLTEEYFLYYGQITERGVFLRILVSLKYLRIYVPNCSGLSYTEISRISLDTAVSWALEHPFASEVEECQCPEGYTGLSCEHCSPGYKKYYKSRRCLRNKR